MSLENDALRLAALAIEMMRAFTDGDGHAFVGLFDTYEDLRRNLKTRLVRQTAVSVRDATASTILQRICSDDGLPIDKVIERLGDGERTSFDKDVWELCEEHLDPWFSREDYIESLVDLRPLIVRTPVSDAVSYLLREVMNCYAFRQYQAAYALCRMMVEASVRDICARKKLLPDLPPNVVLFEMYKWRDLRDKVSSGPLRDRLKNLYADLSKLIHARRTVEQKETRNTIMETLQTVEQLYAHNAL